MSSTIAAISTGQAPGGIGVVRISGPEARQVGDRVFSAIRGKKLCLMDGYTCAFGWVHSSSGDKLDDCVATVFVAPRSYTGEDVVELSCHGGLYITRRVLQEVLFAGAQPAGPGEFTKRAFLNGKMDLAQAESVMEMIHASGRQAARMAEAASSGALTKKVDEIVFTLGQLGAHLAAWADFPEEDVEELAEEELAASLAGCRANLEKLLKGFEQGRIYREGLRTVIAGRPNVGKSTLMNLLAGCQRSIVTEYPGTTRDVVEETVMLAGIPLILADTAGLRETEDPVEEIGVAAARERISSAQLVLAVFDGSCELEAEDIVLMERLRGYPALAVVNKTDLEQKIDLEKIYARFSQVVVISAGEGQGIEELGKALEKLLGKKDFDPDHGELFTERQRKAVQRAVESLMEGEAALAGGMTLDAVTVCVEDALAALYELTGKRVSEEIVDQVFEQFCVGK